MPLIDLQTNLRDLKFGNDRVAGGSSNQPYVQSDIPAPGKESSGDSLNYDFVVRGGLKAVVNSVKDVERLSKYFSDIRNPSGLLFIAKQIPLSRTAVRTQASGFLLNEGIYTPLGTLAQAGGVAFGLHTNKQGLNPFSGLGSIGSSTPNKYEDAVKKTNKPFTIETSTSTTEIPATFGVRPPVSTKSGLPDVNEVGEIFILSPASTTTVTTTNVPKSKNNRLVLLWNDNIKNKNENLVNIRSYPGGPGSTLGIGKTEIKFATGNGTNSVRTGLNNIELKNSKFFEGQGNYNYSVFTTPLEVNEQKQKPLGVSLDIISSFPLSTPPYNQDYDYFNRRTSIISKETKAGEFDSEDKRGYIDGQVASNEPHTYLYKEILNIPEARNDAVKPPGQSIYIGESGVTTPGDFRALLRSLNFPDIPFAPDYTKQNIEAKLGDPGNRNQKNLQFYTTGAGNNTTIPLGAASFNSYDKINASEVVENKDLIPFKIEVIDNDAPSSITLIQFRAFLDNITDSFTSEWKGERYVGRGENFYTYGGFDRKVSLSWTVAAQSKAELMPMYKKLSYLASVCAPDYSSKGYMRGNIVKLTIGGYFNQQPGIITGFSYEMNDDNATWEIGINDGTSDANIVDKTTSQLPHLIKVKGFNFIPIHTFTPRLALHDKYPFIAISQPS